MTTRDRYHYDESGRVICGATTNAGTPCRLPPIRGRTRCRLHGGATPVGLDSPHFKHGGRSTMLPTRLRETFVTAAEDTELLDLTRDLATVEARLGDVLARVDTGEAGALWRSLTAALAAFEAARARGDGAGMEQHLDALRAAAVRGARDADAWAEALRLIEQRRRLVESEGRRRLAMQEMISAERLDLLVSHLIRVIQANVSDPTTRHRIAAGLTAVLGAPER